MKDQATRQIRVPPSTLRAENRALGEFAFAHARALFAALYASAASRIRTLCPTSMSAKTFHCDVREGGGMSFSMIINTHYNHINHNATRSATRSMKSVKSVFSYYHFFSRVGFLDKFNVLNWLVRFNGDRISLTSLTTLIRGIFA